MRLVVTLIVFFLFIPSLAVAQEEKAKSSESNESGINYLEITPKLTFNLAERRKYLQVNAQLLVEGAEAVEKIRTNMPAIKHELIMLYSGRTGESLQTTEQREALRKETLAAIKKVLEKYKSSEGFKDIFFTEFLVNY